MSRTAAAGKLRGRPALVLASGVVVLEFATAISTFVSGTLLPVIERDLAAERVLPLLVAGTTVGMFTALPLASRIIERYPAARVLTLGLLASLLGSGVAAAAPTPLVFAAGRFVAGFAGAVLAVYGISAAIRHLEDSLRLRVVAAMSAMWILPAMVGPTATLFLEQWVGWRWALLSPIPLMVVGRLLVVRALPPQQPEAEPHRPLARALLVPVGVAGFVALGATPWWPVAPLALAVALAGFMALMPPGTGRLAPGPPAALAGLTLFGAGYFGANALVTLLFTVTYDTTLVRAGIALSASPLAWGVAALVAPRLGVRGAPPLWGLLLSTAGVATMALAGFLDLSWAVALVAWTAVGLGIGLSYPGLYLRATTEGHSLSATQLAAAAITTESFGGLVGGSAGAALASLSGSLGITRGDAFAWAYAGFAVVLGAASVAAARATIPDRTPTAGRA